MGFKAGDLVVCINSMRASTFRPLLKGVTYEVARVKTNGNLTLVGFGANDGYFPHRFASLPVSPITKDGAEEYEEIMLADKLVNG